MGGVFCCAQHYTTPHIVTLHSIILDLERERHDRKGEREEEEGDGVSSDFGIYMSLTMAKMALTHPSCSEHSTQLPSPAGTPIILIPPSTSLPEPISLHQNHHRPRPHSPGRAKPRTPFQKPVRTSNQISNFQEPAADLSARPARHSSAFYQFLEAFEHVRRTGARVPGSRELDKRSRGG